MNKTILGISLAAVFVAFMMTATTAQAVPNGFLTIKTSNTAIADDSLNVNIKTKSAIPTNGKSGAFGYAVLTDGGSGVLDNVLVLVTHLPIDDSTHEDQRSGFHTHVLDLMTPSSSCSEHSLEVDLGNSVANSAFDSDYTFSVHDVKASVSDVPLSDLGDAENVVGIVSFTVTPIFDGETLTNLCVDVTG